MAAARAAPRLAGCSSAELERTGLGAQARAKNFWCISTLRLIDQKNRTGIGAHPVRTPGRRNPVISTAQKGYVRRSEVIHTSYDSRDRRRLGSGDLAVPVRAWCVC